jgi:hypothetical protein
MRPLGASLQFARRRAVTRVTSLRLYKAIEVECLRLIFHHEHRRVLSQAEDLFRRPVAAGDGAADGPVPTWAR